MSNLLARAAHPRRWRLPRRAVTVLAAAGIAAASLAIPGGSAAALPSASVPATVTPPTTLTFGQTVQFGANGDVPVPADYNGDGRTEFAVFRPAQSTWY